MLAHTLQMNLGVGEPSRMMLGCRTTEESILGATSAPGSFLDYLGTKLGHSM
jgi:hypothetical protein